MLKMFSILVVAGAVIAAGGGSASAASGCCSAAPAPVAPAPATARAPRAPATASRQGTQTIRRYSASPGASRAPAMRSYRSNRSSGPSWTATRKVLGY